MHGLQSIKADSALNATDDALVDRDVAVRLRALRDSNLLLLGHIDHSGSCPVPWKSPIRLQETLLLATRSSVLGVCWLHGSAYNEFVFDIVDVFEQTIGCMQFRNEQMKF